MTLDVRDWLSIWRIRSPVIGYARRDRYEPSGNAALIDSIRAASPSDECARR
jgi:hypothetical protein